jgi:hypothetical protein
LDGLASSGGFVVNDHILSPAKELPATCFTSLLIVTVYLVELFRDFDGSNTAFPPISVSPLPTADWAKERADYLSKTTTYNKSQDEILDEIIANAFASLSNNNNESTTTRFTTDKDKYEFIKERILIDSWNPHTHFNGVIFGNYTNGDKRTIKQILTDLIRDQKVYLNYQLLQQQSNDEKKSSLLYMMDYAIEHKMRP